MSLPSEALRQSAPPPRAATPPTLAEKLHKALRHLNITVDHERGESLVTKLDQVEAELDDKGRGFKAEQRAGAIRVRRLVLTSILPFETLTVDVDAFPGDVVALVGPIGAGKSVLLEAAMLACYRKAPTRGTLKELAAGADASVRAEIETATGSWTVLQRLDGPYVFDGAGFETVKASAKDYQDWARRHLPPAALVQATISLAQENRGLLALGASPTKDLLLSMSGGEVYQRIATMAAARGRACETKSAELGGRIEEQQRSAAMVDVERREIGAIGAKLEPAILAAEQARAAVNEARSADPGDPGLPIEREARAALQRANAATSAIETARRARYGFERGVLAAADRIRAAGAHVIRFGEEHQAAETEIAKLEAEEIALGSKLRAHKDERIGALRAALGRFSGLGRGRSTRATAAAIAKAALEADDLADSQSLTIPMLLEAIRDRRATLQAERARASQALFEARQLAAQLQALEHAEALHAEAGAAMAAGEEEVAREKARAEELLGEAAEARARVNRPNLDVLEAAARQAELAVTEFRGRAAAANARLEGALRAAKRLDESQGSFVEAMADRGEWELIERAFGRDGIQAVEVDAMGPSLCRVANELLEDTGGRWSVDSDEAFELAVVDHRQGRRKIPRALSCGEKVLVSEALTGALTVLACERARSVGPTIIRDETGADLDKADAATWMKMLRREAGMVGASKVIVASHDRHVVLASDARMLLRNGSLGELQLKEVR